LKKAIILISIVFLFSITSVAIAYSEEDVDLLFQNGLESYQNDKIDEAISYFEKVLEIDPNHVDALSNIGGLVSTIGKHDEAFSYLDRALEIEPNHVRALINKGILLAFLGESDEGAFYFEKALEIEPDNVDALSNRGVQLVNEKNYQEAIIYFEKVIEIDPYNLLAIKYVDLAKYSLGYYGVKGFKEFIIYDNQGNLITYFKSPYLSVLNHTLAQEYIDSLDVIGEISFNGTNYKVLQILFKTLSERDRTLAGTFVYDLRNPELNFILSSNWGFPLAKDDVIITLYTLYIPIE